MKYPISIFILAIGAFAIGMTEFVIMGLLQNVATDLHVSISTTGQLITGYALGVAIGGPILTLLTLRLSRKRLLLLLMCIFILGNAISAMSHSYALLMISRIVTSLSHGTFLGISAILAAKLVTPEKRGSAVSLVFTGLTVANVLGVPFGTFIGHQLGWRYTFGVIAVFGIISLFGIIFFVPNPKETGSVNVRKEIGSLGNPQIILALLMTVFSFASVFAAFTYIEPILTNITGFKESNITIILVLYGLGVTLGNMVGGKLADWKLMPSLIVVLIALTLILVVFYFTQENKVLTLITVFIWGMISFSIVPMLQFRTMNIADDAPNLVTTLNNSGFNIGNAGGAYIGGLVVDGIGTNNITIVGAGISIIAIFIALLSFILEKKQKLNRG